MELDTAMKTRPVFERENDECSVMSIKSAHIQGLALQCNRGVLFLTQPCSFCVPGHPE